jgi:hypothetical protein
MRSKSTESREQGMTWTLPGGRSTIKLPSKKQRGVQALRPVDFAWRKSRNSMCPVTEPLEEKALSTCKLPKYAQPGSLPSHEAREDCR